MSDNMTPDEAYQKISEHCVSVLKQQLKPWPNEVRIGVPLVWVQIWQPECSLARLPILEIKAPDGQVIRIYLEAEEERGLVARMRDYIKTKKPSEPN